MGLPKLQVPIFICKLHSVDEPVKFRPFSVKEEKVLLIAKESIDDSNILLDSVRQIVNNCVISKIDVSKLPMFDLIYLFVQLRSKSIGNILELNLRDNEDNKIYKVEVNLDNISLTINPNHTNKIKLSDNIGLIMKYPTIETLKNKDLNNIDDSIEIVKQCIESVYDSDNVYKFKDQSKEEIDEFFNTMSIQNISDIRSYFETMPSMNYTVSYTNSKGTVQNYEVNNLKNFFQ